jgi:hypothetical protein
MRCLQPRYTLAYDLANASLMMLKKRLMMV